MAALPKTKPKPPFPPRPKPAALKALARLLAEQMVDDALSGKAMTPKNP